MNGENPQSKNNPNQRSLTGALIDDRFYVQSLLGSGATSSVYRARDKQEERDVAIKILHEHLSHNELLLARFKQEAHAASILKHPNIVSIYNYAVSSGLPYLTMELVEGQTLQEVLTGVGWLPLTRAMPIFQQICAALTSAHELSIIHRDLKPGNVILSKTDSEQELVKILDFGSAQLAPMLSDTVLKLTQTGEMLGSILYMSPEQCLEQEVEPSSDIYALGCIMYETLTGKPALAARTIFETMNKHLTTMPEPLAQVRPDLTFPDGLEKIIFKAMAKNPRNRFQSATELQAALKKLTLKVSSRHDSKKAATEKGAVRESTTPPSSTEAALVLNFEPQPDITSLQSQAGDRLERPYIIHDPSTTAIPLTFFDLFTIIASLWFLFRIIFRGDSFNDLAPCLLMAACAPRLIYYAFILMMRSFHHRRRLRNLASSLPIEKIALLSRKTLRGQIFWAGTSQRPMSSASEPEIGLRVRTTEGPREKYAMVITASEQHRDFWQSLTGRTGDTKHGKSPLPLGADIILDPQGFQIGIQYGQYFAKIIKSYKLP